MYRLRLTLAYDGAAFAGSQIQPGQRTVQGVVEGALATLDGAPVRAVFAGRTDTGVHALGQVAHADVQRERGADQWRQGVEWPPAAGCAHYQCGDRCRIGFMPAMTPPGGSIGTRSGTVRCNRR